jgi:hypothetical protein
MERDPSGYEDGPNLYLALAANPASRADPYGLAAEESRPIGSPASEPTTRPTTGPTTQPTTQPADPTFRLNIKGHANDLPKEYCYDLRPTGIKDLKTSIKWDETPTCISEKILLGTVGGLEKFIKGRIDSLNEDEKRTGLKHSYQNPCPKGKQCTDKQRFSGETPFEITFEIRFSASCTARGTISGVATVEGFIGKCC